MDVNIGNRGTTPIHQDFYVHYAVESHSEATARRFADSRLLCFVSPRRQGCAHAA